VNEVSLTSDESVIFFSNLAEKIYAILRIGIINKVKVLFSQLFILS